MTFDRSTGLRALLAAVILSLAAIPARAEGGVGVVVTGEATMQPQLVAQLETWLRAHGHELVAAPLPPEAINALIDCFVIEDQVCARRVVEEHAKSSSVVFAQVHVTSGETPLDRTVKLTAYWLDKGRDAVVERRVCARCTDVTMRRSADDLMTALVGASASGGLLELTSRPPGATVTIGGKVIGPTPIEHGLPPGAHEVVLELPGRPRELRSVKIEKGQTTAVEVAFGSPPLSRRKKLTYAALAGGAALVVVGGILIGLDEDPDPPAGPQTNPTYFDSAPGGVALALTGVAAIATGMYFLVRDPGRRSAPAVSLVPRGGLVGWTGRF